MNASEHQKFGLHGRSMYNAVNTKKLFYWCPVIIVTYWYQNNWIVGPKYFYYYLYYHYFLFISSSNLKVLVAEKGEICTKFALPNVKRSPGQWKIGVQTFWGSNYGTELKCEQKWWVENVPGKVKEKSGEEGGKNIKSKSRSHASFLSRQVILLILNRLQIRKLHPIYISKFLAVPRQLYSYIDHLVTEYLTPSYTLLKNTTMSTLRDLWPFTHLIRVMRRHGLNKNDRKKSRGTLRQKGN